MKKDNTNHTNVILNLFQDLQKDKMLKPSWIIGGSAGSTQPSPGRASLLPKSAVQHDNTVVVQNNVTECPPIEGGPKSLISRRGKNALVYNQEPSPEFVSSSQLTNKFYPLTKREGKRNRNELINLSTYRLIDVKKILRLKPQNDVINKNIKTLEPQCPSIPSVKNLFPYFPISLSLKKKVAFTLAEVLITLGIIGIVAAMTIPTLITAHQKKQTVVKLQRAISVLNQAYKLSFDDVGEPSAQEAYDMGSEAYFKKYWAPYIKVLNYCSKANACGYSKNYFDTLNYTNKPLIVVTEWGAGTSFLTADGFFYTIRTSGGNLASPSREIFVDINGAKAPNMIGKDVFVLERKEDGEKGGVLIPYGSELNAQRIKQLCSSDSQEKANGYTCAEKIKRAGWEIDKSYPWK